MDDRAILARITELGLELPDPPKPVASSHDAEGRSGAPPAAAGASSAVAPARAAASSNRRRSSPA